MPKKEPKPTQIENDDNKIVEPSTFLETEKEHKDWYHSNTMGKQRGEKNIAPKEVKKEKGSRKHSLRKEK